MTLVSALGGYHQPELCCVWDVGDGALAGGRWFAPMRESRSFRKVYVRLSRLYIEPSNSLTEGTVGGPCVKRVRGRARSLCLVGVLDR